MWSPTRSKCLHRLCPDADLADSAASRLLNYHLQLSPDCIFKCTECHWKSHQRLCYRPQPNKENLHPLLSFNQCCTDYYTGRRSVKARLHSGHHPALRTYLHQLDPDTDPVWTTCKEENHTLHRWLIPNMLSWWSLKTKTYLVVVGDKLLTTHPKTAVVYARKTLVVVEV